MLSILKKLVPFRIKVFLRNCVKKIWRFKEYDEIRKEVYNEFLLQRQKEDEAIPKIDLQPKHIKKKVFGLKSG